jgi:hypothetical protein
MTILDNKPIGVVTAIENIDKLLRLVTKYGA